MLRNYASLVLGSCFFSEQRCHLGSCNTKQLGLRLCFLNGIKLKKNITHLCQALSFFSVYAECCGPNIDILIFHVGLKTVCVPVSGFSFVSSVYIECAG